VGISARGGLEPDLRVLFSAILHGVSLGIFHQGGNLWKIAEAKVWSFLVDLPTNFTCVLIVLRYPSDAASVRIGCAAREQACLTRLVNIGLCISSPNRLMQPGSNPPVLSRKSVLARSESSQAFSLLRRWTPEGHR
jgi:hypothetical protein